MDDPISEVPPSSLGCWASHGFAPRGQDGLKLGGTEGAYPKLTGRGYLPVLADSVPLLAGGDFEALAGTMKLRLHRPQRTFLPRTDSGTWRMLRHLRFGQMSVIAIRVGSCGLDLRWWGRSGIKSGKAEDSIR